MKKILLATLLLITVNLFAQENEKQPKLNISLGVSPPIKIEGMGLQWIERLDIDSGWCQKTQTGR
jgi:hypothetical protein